MPLSHAKSASVHTQSLDRTLTRPAAARIPGPSRCHYTAGSPDPPGGTPARFSTPGAAADEDRGPS
jgi:hypothetical protein